jgi:nucleoside-diphosphate-sugar epimerase
VSSPSTSPSSFATGSADPPWRLDASGRTVAILGADGFIGSHLTRAFVAAGGTVLGHCSARPWRLTGVECDRLSLSRNYQWWSPRGLVEIRELLTEADAVVLLLYRAADGRSRPNHELAVNAATAGRVATLAAATGTRVVFASSADVYGAWHDEPVAEGTQPRPATAYAHAKLEAERLIAAECGARGHVCLRIGTVFGPGEDGPRAIPAFARALSRGVPAVVHGDGTDVRDYVHVSDVAAATLNAALADDPPPVVNVGSGVGRTTLEVLQEVARAVGAAPLVRHEPSTRLPSRLVLDVGLARRALGVEPRLDFAALVAGEAGWLRRRHVA